MDYRFGALELEPSERVLGVMFIKPKAHAVRKLLIQRMCLFSMSESRSCVHRAALWELAQ